MQNFKNFDKKVPFDPGFSPLSFSFIENMAGLKQDYDRQRANHQKKFWLTKMEPKIVELIEKCASFYLGCILWGGFIHCRFKNDPKEISGNTTEKLSAEEQKDLDCAIESKAMILYIESLNRDLKYFLNRPVKIPVFIEEILENYIEFASLNNNFIGTKTTDQIKLPKAVEHFENLSNEQLDLLCEKIYTTINSGKIEQLLEIGFY